MSSNTECEDQEISIDLPSDFEECFDETDLAELPAITEMPPAHATKSYYLEKFGEEKEEGELDSSDNEIVEKEDKYTQTDFTEPKEIEHSKNALKSALASFPLNSHDAESLSKVTN